jgi:ribosomal protein S15P/S13E
MVTKKLTKKDAEKVVTDLYNSGLTSEKIGLALKKDHGIKNFKDEFGLRISQVTGKNDSDLKNIQKKLSALKNHFDKNKHDQSAKRRMIKTAAQLKTLNEYLSK